MGFADAFAIAMTMLLKADPALMEIIGVSLGVSLSAVLLATIAGVPLGGMLAVARFPGRMLLIMLCNTLMGLPPVVVGLGLYLLLSTTGPLGVLQLVYTPVAMVIAQFILILPIIAALTCQHLQGLDEEYDFQLRLFGISLPQRILTLVREARLALLTVVLAGFGRAIAEVGAVMIVGGNINHVTRTMTTAITLETARGELGMALALGIVLLFLALGVNAVLMAIRLFAEQRYELG